MLKKLRFTLWWLLKSPWTKKYGILATLNRKLKSVLSSSLKHNHISICVALSNRNAQLQNVFLPSFSQLNGLVNTEVILVCGIDEEEPIKQAVLQMKLENIKVISTKDRFSRSKYLNIALQHASYKCVLVTDIDVKLPKDLTKQFFKRVNLHQAWYPICDMLDENGSFSHTYPEGVGLIGFYNSSNFRYDERITDWGNEDWDFLYTLFKQGIYPKRTINNGFIHCYHEPVDKNNYKKEW